MANRNEQNRQLADALQALAQAIGRQGGGAGAVAYQGIDRFQRNDPPTFKGVMIQKVLRSGFGRLRRSSV